MKTTKQGVRDLNALPGRSRGRRPDPDAEVLANGRLPFCNHRFDEVEQYDEAGLFFEGYFKLCRVCGVTR